MPFVKVAHLSSLAADSVTEVLIDEYPYAICNVGGEIRALSGICIHQGGPLGQGQIHEGRVVCPYHLWEFDCRTGEYDFDAAKRVATYDVRVQDNEVFVEVPERA